MTIAIWRVRSSAIWRTLSAPIGASDFLASFRCEKDMNATARIFNGFNAPVPHLH